MFGLVAPRDHKSPCAQSCCHDCRGLLLISEIYNTSVYSWYMHVLHGILNGIPYRRWRMGTGHSNPPIFILYTFTSYSSNPQIAVSAFHKNDSFPRPCRRRDHGSMNLAANAGVTPSVLFCCQSQPKIRPSSPSRGDPDPAHSLIRNSRPASARKCTDTACVLDPWMLLSLHIRHRLARGRLAVLTVLQQRCHSQLSRVAEACHRVLTRRTTRNLTRLGHRVCPCRRGECLPCV